MFVYEATQLVPITERFICEDSFQLKIRLFSVSINAKHVVITFVKVVSLE